MFYVVWFFFPCNFNWYTGCTNDYAGSEILSKAIIAANSSDSLSTINMAVDERKG